jgi:hypothetical protein
MKPMEETGTDPDEIRELRSLHDIVSEISDRRFDAAFGEDVSLEAREKIQEHPDRIESWEDFDEAARRAGVFDPEAILGFSTRPEEPAHIREGSVPVEVATKIHEDIHRSTHPETLHEMSATAELLGLYEGLTEYFTQKGVEHLHGNAEAAYPQELVRAERLAGEVGDEELRGYFFRHEFSEEIEEAIRRL